MARPRRGRPLGSKNKSVRETVKATAAKDKEVTDNINAKLSRKAANKPMVSMRQMYDASMDKLLKDNDSSVISNSGDMITVGIKVPFMLQVLLGMSVLPLGVVIVCDGPPMSYKTTLMYEFGRFFKNMNGWLDMILTEGKVSPELVRAVIGWDQDSRDAVKITKVVDMNAMMRAITSRIQLYKVIARKGVNGNKPTGFLCPVMIGVDSLMGSNAAETYNKIEKQGDATRGYAIEANILTPYLKNVGSNISMYPYIVFLINHRKETVNKDSPYAPMDVQVPGGKHPKFQATYEIITHLRKEYQQVDPHPKGGAEIENRMIELSNGKNSAGTNGRKFIVRVSWRSRLVNKALPDGETRVVSRQITQWHWEEAIPGFLIDWVKGNKAAQQAQHAVRGRQAKLDAVLHLRAASVNRFYSNTFGITKDNAVSGMTMGRMIEENEEILVKLRAMFGIIDGYAWDASVPYDKLLAKLKRFSTTDGASVLDEQVDDLIVDRFEDEKFESVRFTGVDDEEDELEEELDDN